MPAPAAFDAPAVAWARVFGMLLSVNHTTKLAIKMSHTFVDFYSVPKVLLTKALFERHLGNASQDHACGGSRDAQF